MVDCSFQDFVIGGECRERVENLDCIEVVRIHCESGDRKSECGGMQYGAQNAECLIIEDRVLRVVFRNGGPKPSTLAREPVAETI